MQDDKRVAQHLNTLVGTEEMRSRVDTESSLRSLLIRLLFKSQGTSFEEEVFDGLYREFEAFFYSDVAQYRVIAVLDDFHHGR